MRAISAANIRDLAASAFGAILPMDPTPSDDADGTAGNGSYDAPSQWMNIGSKSIWVCFNGAHNAADWAEVALVRNLPPPPPPGPGIPTAMWFVQQGTTLSGVYSIGILPLAAGYRLLTWDGIDPKTWGIWIVQTTAWTRAPEFPAGMVFNGPAYVWTAYNATDFVDYQQLITIFPPSWTYGVNPTTWTVGTDDLIATYATPTSTVTPGTFIRISVTLGRESPAMFNVNYDGPTSLDQWATAAGALTATNVTSGYPAGNLSPGTLGSGVLLPAGQISGTVPAGSLPTLDTIAGSSGSLSASNVGTGYPYADLSGAPSPPSTNGGDTTITTAAAYTTVINATAMKGLIGVWTVTNLGPNTARVQVTTVDAIQGTQVQTTGLGSGSNTQPQDLISNGGLANTCSPPLTSVQVAVQDFVAGNHTSVRIRWAIVEV